MLPYRGFTLIELLVVIAIIGLLASIVLASLSTARIKGQDAARISDVKSLEAALELYYSNNNGYPTSAGSSNGDVPLNDTTLVGELVPKYIPSMPATLIADGDRYYALGATSGVSQGYDMRVYLAGTTTSWCRAGTVPGYTGDWGTPTVCNF
jgi:prepilin-type N-terminal cleavage/methylation domain-containing protein